VVMLASPGGMGAAAQQIRNLAPSGSNERLIKAVGAVLPNACSCCKFRAARGGGSSSRPYMA
jgi:hypothetical protein